MKILSRRDFLKHAAVSTCGLAVWGGLPIFGRSAHALSGNGTKTLIINMNGGWDTLSLLQPSAGTVYDTLSSMRATLKTDPALLLPADSRFGFHPALKTFKAQFDAGRLAAVNCVGYENMSRSHKDAEVAFARGVLNRNTPQATGFINRLGDVNEWPSLRAVCVSGPEESFDGGAYRGIQVNGLQSFRFTGDFTQSRHEDRHRQNMLYSVSQQWEVDSSKPKQQEAVDGVDIAVNTSEILSDAVQAATFAQAYPNTSLGRSLRDVDILFATPTLGTELGYVRRSGFDTHSNQAATLSPMLTEFDDALACFIANMKAKNLWQKLNIVILSEFGRTNRENGSLGTDHGGAVSVFVLGGAVNGGIHGDITSTDLTSGGWLPMKYPVVDIYHQMVTRMGYDADKIFQFGKGGGVPALFS